MIVLNIVCFLLMLVGIVLLLGITPDMISGDVMHLVSPKQSLRDQALKATGRKKSRKLTAELNRIWDALETTGRGDRFAVACTTSLGLLSVGCILAISIGNVFLIPVFALALALIPFVMIKRTIAYYEKHIKEELETTLSIITSSYLRNDDFVHAVRENLDYLKPPMKEIFSAFVVENSMITSDVRQSLRNLKERIDNQVYREWCDIVIACQDDRTLKGTLMPVVAKLTDIRLANNEIKGILVTARTEYFVMAGMVVGNVPLLYVLNKEWFNALMYTTLGKVVVGLCGIVILVTYILMMKYTKPVEYRG